MPDSATHARLDTGDPTTGSPQGTERVEGRSDAGHDRFVLAEPATELEPAGATSTEAIAEHGGRVVRPAS
jgi:hypothetical protein